MHRPASEDSASTRSSSIASSKGVSEGHSSASGVSDTTDAPLPQQLQQQKQLPYKPANPVSRGSAQEAAPSTAITGGGVSIALEAATAQCSMCDDAASSLLCTQCGRLSFCAPCCISLHDNKFLSGHKLLSLEPMREGQVVLLADLKEAAKEKKKVQQEQQLPPQPRGDQLGSPTHAATANSPLKQRGAESDRPPVLTSPLKSSAQQSKHADPSTAANRQDGSPHASSEMPDAAALAADRNIIQARLAELQSCRTLLHQASEGLSRERFQCKDLSQTAAESIRKRFDVLRRVIAEKESEYIATVETAAKKRLEDATKASFEATAALAECDAFLEQTDLQLDRLAANKKMFAEARPSLLASTEAKLRSVDDSIQKLQADLDRITTTSLGVHIVLDRAIEEVQRLIVPQLIQPAHLVDASHVKPIRSEAFTASPGVKVVRQSSVERAPVALGRLGSAGVGGPATTAGSSGATVHRQSFQQELDALRGTPLRELRQQQQQQQQAAAAASTIAAAAASPQPLVKAQQAGPMPISLAAGRRPSVGSGVGGASAATATTPAPATGSYLAPDHLRSSAPTAADYVASHNTSVPASAVIAKISQKFAASGATLARALTKPSAPKELEKLREVVAATTASLSPWHQQQRRGSLAGGGGGSSASVGSRCRSPIAAVTSSQRVYVDSPRAVAARTDSPMRQTQLAPYRYSISPARTNPDATPGPGAYYKPTDFTARSLLSTPPRRR